MMWIIIIIIMQLVKGFTINCGVPVNFLSLKNLYKVRG